MDPTASGKSAGSAGSDANGSGGGSLGSPGGLPGGAGAKNPNNSSYRSRSNGPERTANNSYSGNSLESPSKRARPDADGNGQNPDYNTTFDNSNSGTGAFGSTFGASGTGAFSATAATTMGGNRLGSQQSQRAVRLLRPATRAEREARVAELRKERDCSNGNFMRNADGLVSLGGVPYAVPCDETDPSLHAAGDGSFQLEPSPWVG